MKQRITYVQPDGRGIDVEDILIKNDGLSFNNAPAAALEKRLTIGLTELPRELAAAFVDIHELHVRWSSPSYHKNTSPFVSRLPSGLHVFFTPRSKEKDVNICALLKRAFSPSLKCDTVQESFSSPPLTSERFSASSTYQYFHILPKIAHFSTFVSTEYCSSHEGCTSEVLALNEASTLDLDFDAISHAIVLTASWAPGEHPGVGGTEGMIRRLGAQDSIEVGVLQSEKPDEPEELKFGGYLTVIGEDDKPGPVLFSFPSRHHPLPSGSRTTFTTSISSPSGLHPQLSLSFRAASLKPPKDSCALHAYLTLPSAVFLDRYQLSDPLFLASHRLVALHSLSLSGEQDLEAPDWVVKRWGSAALIELAHPDAANSNSKEWNATIPTHLRYLAAQTNTTTPSYVDLSIPDPAVFWACEAEEGLKMATNPFDRVNLGYDGLFGPKTMFYHVPPGVSEGQQLVKSVKVPVLDQGNAWSIQVGSAVAVALGFAWMIYRLLRPLPARNTNQKKAI